MTAKSGIRARSEECDCDLDFEPHPMNKVHYRACKAPYGDRDVPEVTCQVIRGHKGPHKAEVIRWFEWAQAVTP